MRRLTLLYLLSGVLLAYLPAWGQQVFDVLPPPSSGTFSGPVIFSDSSTFSSTGLEFSSGSEIRFPDRAAWTSGGPTFAAASTLTFPDLSTWTATQLRFAGTLSIQGPDTSVWNQSGLQMAVGRQLYVDGGSNTAPGLAFRQQASLGLYRFGQDDVRVTVSEGLQAARFYLAGTTPQLQAPAGASTSFVPVGGRLCSSGASVPTSGTGLEALATCQIPAASLSSDGASYLKVRAWAATAANGNSKTLAIAFGATTCATHTNTLNNGSLVVEATILRMSATVQTCAGSGLPSTGAQSVTVAAPAETLANQLTLAINGTTPTAAGDLTLKGFTVEVMN